MEYRSAAPATLEKEAQLTAFRQHVLSQLEPMTTAQVGHATGVSFTVLRAPDGTYTRATDVKQIDAACAAGAQAFQIFTQAPSTHAFTALMDRTFGKPSERIELAGPGGQPIQVIKPW